MKKYRANQPMTLRDGVVELTDEQLRRRFGQVRPTEEEGVYEIAGECRFKAGEEFSWSGEPPKADTALFGEVDLAEDEPEGDESKKGAKKADPKK